MRYSILALICIIYAAMPVAAQMDRIAQFGGDLGVSLALATAIQKAVESGNYVFVAVIALMFGLQVLKVIFGQRSSSIRQNAAQYSALGGAAIGSAMTSVTGGDPVEGAVGGLLVGNAASGLYSTLKPIGALGKKYLRGR